jgi:hypothetical protein
MVPFRRVPFTSPLRPWAPGVLALALTLAAVPAPAQRAEATLAQDPRLDRRVTLQLRKAPLSDVTAELGRLAEVNLTTTSDTADEPAVVRVTDQPAREIMRQLARHFGYRWVRSGAAPAYRYELQEDLSAKRAAEALRRQDRLRGLAALQTALLKQAEIHRARPNPRSEAPLRVALALTPAHWEALAGGRELVFSTRESPGAQVLPQPLAGDVLGLLGAAGEGAVESARIGLWLEFRLSEVGLQHSTRTTGAANASGGSAASGGSVANAFSRMGDPTRVADPAAEAAWQRDPVLGARRPFVVDPVKAAHGRRLQAGRVVFLHTHEVLTELAEAYDLDLIADAYRAQGFGRQPPRAPTEMALYQALNRHLEHVADWSRDGEFIRSRSRTWYHDRPAEIPARLAKSWAAALRRERRLTLANATDFAMVLRAEQWPHLVAVLRDEGVHLLDSRSRESWLYEGSWAVLRAHGALPPPVRERLRAGGRLRLADLPEASRRWLQTAFSLHGRALPGLELPPGGLPPGLLSFSTVTLRREVTSAEGSRVSWVLHALDGPNAGKPMGSFALGGAVSAGHRETNQVVEQLQWRYDPADGGALTVQMSLPWVYAEPLDPEGGPGQRN